MTNEDKPGQFDIHGKVIGTVGGGIFNARNVAMRDIHEHHYTPPDFPLNNLPPPNPNFTGRQELLTTIAATFTQSSIANRQSSIVITQAIVGLGGVGKTQLALATPTPTATITT